jgi:hypothetical protein
MSPLAHRSIHGGGDEGVTRVTPLKGVVTDVTHPLLASRDADVTLCDGPDFSIPNPYFP